MLIKKRGKKNQQNRELDLLSDKFNEQPKNTRLQAAVPSSQQRSLFQPKQKKSTRQNSMPSMEILTIAMASSIFIFRLFLF